MGQQLSIHVLGPAQIGDVHGLDDPARRALLEDHNLHRDTEKHFLPSLGGNEMFWGGGEGSTI